MLPALPETRRFAFAAAGLLIVAGIFAWPSAAGETFRFVVQSYLEVIPMVAIGLVLSAWVAASGAGEVTAKIFRGRSTTVICLAAALGAITPVCGVTVLPLMTSLLASGVPLAPIMAFWVSSPVTDPGLFAATWAVLGPGFAIGKTLAALAIGVLAGIGTAFLAGTTMVREPLRSARRPHHIQCAANTGGFSPRIWQDPTRRRTFRSELLRMTKLVTLCLTLAFAAEHLLRALLPPDVLGPYMGQESAFAIPLAVTAGAPLYLDGYAALPLVRGLLDVGMSPGAALAFLVAGSAVSIWGVLAVLPVLKVSTSALFVCFAVLGSLLSGYAFEGLLALLP